MKVVVGDVVGGGGVVVNAHAFRRSRPLPAPRLSGPSSSAPAVSMETVTVTITVTVVGGWDPHVDGEPLGGVGEELLEATLEAPVAAGAAARLALAHFSE